ncbi:hypothetical protein [Coraliomargarita akajimensis]|uniref:Lipoprotein n=1 Tax=Coraliomargarita akajimensis (strain DSM 45221 / IAM 15411 / JCM 23193 / KCTC 12865 / 04OKA010-24) TaxID=583355 RepID=D5EP22_CORAD|nr:hypothetical protein [Coraliomargarita akajimensis]ADE55532.1 hypothetical protein Caka_2516 [Coraliomargarita akajimensis DSM 45221]
MKKFITLLLSASMLNAVFTGCAKSEEEQMKEDMDKAAEEMPKPE